jgi:hypothetical protein
MQRLVLAATVGLGLVFHAICAHSGPVYRCVDADGATAFQDRPCAAGQRQSEVMMAPPPAPAPSPHYAIDARTRQAARVHAAARKPKASAYECRGSDGRLFYRLGGCPHSLAAADGTGGAVHVSARRVDRERACRQMRRAGAIGRAGHEFDESVSTYDKDLGRDPCA